MFSFCATQRGSWFKSSSCFLSSFSALFKLSFSFLSQNSEHTSYDRRSLKYLVLLNYNFLFRFLTIEPPCVSPGAVAAPVATVTLVCTPTATTSWGWRTPPPTFRLSWGARGRTASGSASDWSTWSLLIGFCCCFVVLLVTRKLSLLFKVIWKVYRGMLLRAY